MGARSSVITVPPQSRLSSRARRRGPALLTHVRRNRLARRPWAAAEALTGYAGGDLMLGRWSHPDSATVTAFGRNPLLLATLAQGRLAGLENQLNRLFRSCV
jgi:hypothetical protein